MIILRAWLTNTLRICEKEQPQPQLQITSSRWIQVLSCLHLMPKYTVKLQYLAKCTHHDLQTALAFLTTRVKSPDIEARYYRNIRALRTLHIVRKTLCHSHRIVHTFGLVSFHHTQAHTFGLNKLHSSALITSSHSSPTNKHHSSHHTFNSFTRYAVFLSIVPFFSHKRASQFSCLQVIDKLGSLPIHASHRLIPSNHSRSRRSTSSSIIT